MIALASLHRTTTTLTLAALTLAALTIMLGACTGTATPVAPASTPTRDLAQLHLDAATGLTGPDTVRAGVPFLVTGYAGGSGTLACNTPDGTDVVTTDSVVRIVAYMRYPATGSQQLCTMDYRLYAYPVTVQLPRAGVVTVRFVGGRGTSSGARVADSLVKRVVVRP